MGLQTITGQRDRICLDHPVPAIGDHGDLRIIDPCGQVILDFRVVGHQVIADPTTRPLIEPEPGFSNQTPLFALPFDAIHIDDIGLALDPLKNIERRGVVAEGQKQSLLTQCMNGGLPVEKHRTRHTGVGDRDMNPMNTLPFTGRYTAGTVFLAVDSDFPALLDQIEGELFGKRFKTAVFGGDATNAEDVEVLGNHTLSYSLLRFY